MDYDIAYSLEFKYILDKSSSYIGSHVRYEYLYFKIRCIEKERKSMGKLENLFKRRSLDLKERAKIRME